MGKKIQLVVVFWLVSGTFLSAQHFFVTTGKLPQLAYSNGTDRLGSAKMGYVDTGILVRVLDSIQGNYRVQLSRHRSAYLMREYLRPVADTLSAQPALMESWMVRGGSDFDTVLINVNRRVLYTSSMESNPAVIALELFGVQSNTNWITQLNSATGIRTVDWKQTEDDVVQVRIQLHQQQHLGYSIGYSGKRLQIIIRKKTKRLRLSRMQVAIDAGHGGTNTGASGLRSGMLEKNYTLLFAQELNKMLLRKGAGTFMVRAGDTTIDNKDRVLTLQQLWPDVLISFHLNSSSRVSAKGVSTYYRHLAFRPLSQYLLRELLTVDGLEEFGNIGSFNFQLVQPTAFPACLVEVAFLSNPDDEQLILNPEFRKAVARKVFNGLKRWVRSLD